MKVSIVIPCIPKDFNSGDLDKSLCSIKKSTILPNENIVVLSGCNEILQENINKFQMKWSLLLNNFRILEYENIQTCGLNRKLGSLNASNEIIINADADDTFHPQRIEIFKYFFETTDAVAINHLYIPTFLKFDNYDIPSIKILAISDDIYTHYFPKNKWTQLSSAEYYGSYLNMTTHDGHMGFRRKILDEVVWDDINTGCDSFFLHKVCFHYKKNIFLHACLSKYTKADFFLKSKIKEEISRKLKRSLSNEYTEIKPTDPCPCGSGKKYKKCKMRRKCLSFNV